MEQTTNNNTNNSQYKLSIQISLNGLSFCIVNSDNVIIAIEKEDFGMYLSPEHTLDKIKYTFEHYSVLKHDFKRVEVIYQNELYTFVPKSLFDPDYLRNYLRYHIKVLDTDFIEYDELDQQDIVAVYIPYANINNFFFETFGSFTYQHSASIFLQTIMSKAKNKETATVYVQVHKKLIDIVIIKKGKLMLANVYQYESKEDFLYYLLFAVEQLRLNPEEFLLVLSGCISKGDDLYTIAYTYIRNISFADHLPPLAISENISNINSQEHFILLKSLQRHEDHLRKL